MAKETVSRRRKVRTVRFKFPADTVILERFVIYYKVCVMLSVDTMVSKPMDDVCKSNENICKHKF